MHTQENEPIAPLFNWQGFDWNRLTRHYDWIAQMQGVPQNPVFHAEGDV